MSSEYTPSPMPLDNSREMLSQGTVTPDIESTIGVDSTLEYGQCQMRGNLYKKERFMTWTKLYCTIRNNFLECHKSSGDHYTPSLKLFLPGSEIKEGGGDAKKRWALQVYIINMYMYALSNVLYRSHLKEIKEWYQV